MPRYKGISCILEDFLYLGSVRDAIDWQTLQKHGITHVINCAREWDAHRSVPKPHQVLYYPSLNLADVPQQTLDHVYDAFFKQLEALRTSGERVLVHCMAGVSRSATLVVAFLMKHRNMTLKQAFMHVKSRRQFINPNAGFREALLRFERKLYNGRNTMQPIDWIKKYTRPKVHRPIPERWLRRRDQIQPNRANQRT